MLDILFDVVYQNILNMFSLYLGLIGLENLLRLKFFGGLVTLIELFLSVIESFFLELSCIGSTLRFENFPQID